jgi:predicted nucleic acid-binding protein
VSPKGTLSRPVQRLFVDASAFVAVVVENDDRHTDAVAVMQRLQSEAWHLYTITVILAEAHVLIRSAIGTERAATFLTGVYASPATTVEPLSRQDEQNALAILQQYADKTFSFADALAFAVCERLGVAHAFSFDRHFRQYGKLHLVDTSESW